MCTVLGLDIPHFGGMVTAASRQQRGRRVKAHELNGRHVNGLPGARAPRRAIPLGQVTELLLLLSDGRVQFVVPAPPVVPLLQEEIAMRRDHVLVVG